MRRRGWFTPPLAEPQPVNESLTVAVSPSAVRAPVLLLTKLKVCVAASPWVSVAAGAATILVDAVTTALTATLDAT